MDYERAWKNQIAIGKKWSIFFLCNLGSIRHKCSTPCSLLSPSPRTQANLSKRENLAELNKGGLILAPQPWVGRSGCLSREAFCCRLLAGPASYLSIRQTAGKRKGLFQLSQGFELFALLLPVFGAEGLVLFVFPWRRLIANFFHFLE